MQCLQMSDWSTNQPNLSNPQVISKTTNEHNLISSDNHTENFNQYNLNEQKKTR